MRKRLSIEELKDGILRGETLFLSKGITLVESELDEDKEAAAELINELLPYSGKSYRIGITGVPGAGKSTLIEAIGKYLIEKDTKVAVLAVDPSSDISSGSILGDKTRMEELSKSRNAFIRPSSTGKSISGIAKSTRQSIILCEAAGYEIIMVETVGVGQIETLIHNIVDLLMLITLTGAGDELQLIKKGIMEVADIIAINKADGNNLELAEQTAKEMELTVQDFRETSPGWKLSVITVSALNNKSIDLLWNTVELYFSKAKQSKYYYWNRADQNTVWMKEEAEQLLNASFWNSLVVRKYQEELLKKVAEGTLSSQLAARLLFERFQNENN